MRKPWPPTTWLSIDKAAELPRDMAAEVARAYQRRRGGAEHRAAAKRFRDGYDAWAFPGGLDAGLAALKASQTVAVETVCFLEGDPWFFRSGYIKQNIVRHLKHAPLTGPQRHRRAAVIIRSLAGGDGKFAARVARLAPIVAFPSFIAEVEWQASAEEPHVARGAQHVLHELGGARSKPPAL